MTLIDALLAGIAIAMIRSTRNSSKPSSIDELVVFLVDNGEFDISGRVMKAWTMVSTRGVRGDTDLKLRVWRAAEYTAKKIELPRLPSIDSAVKT